ncbi:MAG: 2-dehydro-3-deoxygalactonokinase [Paracoccus denitrificans]|uniref:2-dehydro-3-deoxygalactonokinase n=1 Tax=Paracoccus denitrificans TaxID=266 RepID=A0A533I510_PARDE|nr:MAG: 2-dehydro-3-deoxygalactonokinase [Paracoccus denitrificans]
MNATNADWIAADWGTSNLRVWAMRDDEAIDMRNSDKGMNALASPEEFAAEIARITEGWPALPVVACGMVGARQGWVEVPYRTAPCPAIPELVAVPGDPGGRPVLIAGGVKQSHPPDVMRGEETQIAGILAARPDFDGVICLPGTHTKWVRISAGEICHFQTVMTGEVFSLLSRQSVLRHSMTEGSSDPRIAAFSDAVSEALSRPHQAWANLFRLRAADLVGHSAPGSAEGSLSGMLIGLDLGAARPYWLGEQVLIIGAPRLSALYASALEQQGSAPIIGDTDTATRAGLHAAWRQYRTRS